MGRSGPFRPGAGLMDPAHAPRLPGLPLVLDGYPADSVVNHVRYREFGPTGPDLVYLPAAVGVLTDRPAVGRWEFIEDDNRGAIRPEPVAHLDGMPFYLSVKGVGSAVDPYSNEPLDRACAARRTEDAAVRARLLAVPPAGSDRMVTGELWLKGSPYGGQGELHARTALAVSERAERTDLAGFRIAPVVKVVALPPDLEARLREIYWYRRYRGRFVQEHRLVPSNVRIYFHARNTVGNDVRSVFDRFGIDSDARALRFEVRFVRSTLALLTLFARTLERRPGGGGYEGLDFHDVWLDKDAVVAPDGTVYFVDLEGIEPVAVAAEEVPGRIEDQVYRSLYEFTFAYEQIEGERRRRFGGFGPPKEHFARIVGEAVRDDPYLRLRPDGSGLALEIRNALAEESLYIGFPWIDR